MGLVRVGVFSVPPLPQGLGLCHLVEAAVQPRRVEGPRRFRSPLERSNVSCGLLMEGEKTYTVERVVGHSMPIQTCTEKRNGFLSRCCAVFPVLIREGETRTHTHTRGAFFWFVLSGSRCLCCFREGVGVVLGAFFPYLPSFLGKQLQ